MSACVQRSWLGLVLAGWRACVGHGLTAAQRCPAAVLCRCSCDEQLVLRAGKGCRRLCLALHASTCLPVTASATPPACAPHQWQCTARSACSYTGSSQRHSASTATQHPHHHAPASCLRHTPAHPHRYAVRKVLFSPHAEGLLASCSYDMSVKLWNTHAPEDALVRSWDHHSEFAVGLDLSTLQEGLMASTGWDEAVAVWHQQGVP